MIVIAACSLLLAVGSVASIRWGRLDVALPGSPIAAGGPIGNVVTRYVWWAGVAFYTALSTGLLVVGPGARLAMRLLAVTAGSTAQGRSTEAEEVVGRITVGGTIGVLVFVGILFGLASAALYLVIRRWLPGAWRGGLIMGLVTTAIFATRVEPLRRNNPDFHLVGPGWLAVVTFVVLALGQGLAVAALAGRISRSLPEPTRRPKTVLPYLPMLILVPAGGPAVLLGVGLLVSICVTRLPSLLGALRSNAVTIGGRIVISGAVLAALPGSVSAIIAIAGGA